MSVLIGVDLGTTNFKVSAYDVEGAERGTVSLPSPWQNTGSGNYMEAVAFSKALTGLVERCMRDLSLDSVEAIGVTGMAETMFVETVEGEIRPARAWNSQRDVGSELPPRELFERTGLLDATRTPAVELRSLTKSGVRVKSWSGLSEFAIRALGGDVVSERSLASRSGLVDVTQGEWSEELLSWAGVPDVKLPALVGAGFHAGNADMTRPYKSAVLTVAGHDHLVAAVGSGAESPSHIFDSLGTGEAVISHLDRSGGPLTQKDLQAFNVAGFNLSLGLSDGEFIGLAGLGTGNRFNLLLRKLTEAGYTRHELVDPDNVTPQHAEAQLSSLSSDVRRVLEVLFGRDWQVLESSTELSDIIRLHIDDSESAKGMWWAAVVLGTRNAKTALDHLAILNPQAKQLVAAGGWFANPAICEIRKKILGDFRVPPVKQAGTRGAALLAGLASGVYTSFSNFPNLTSTKE